MWYLDIFMRRKVQTQCTKTSNRYDSDDNRKKIKFSFYTAFSKLTKKSKIIAYIANTEMAYKI